mgnify:CR=1 FL=1
MIICYHLHTYGVRSVHRFGIKNLLRRLVVEKRESEKWLENGFHRPSVRSTKLLLMMMAI